MPQIRFDWTQDLGVQRRRALRALEAGAVLIGVPDDVQLELVSRAGETGLEIEFFESDDGWCLHRADVELELPPRRNADG